MPPQPVKFDVATVRRKFPALKQTVDGHSPIYLDNPGGTQVPGSVIDAMRDYLINANSNTHGAFLTSRLTDQTILNARLAMADFLNAPSERQIVFGQNMTTLTMHFSRSIGKTLKRGDEIILTRMDHDANVSPWLRIADDHDLKVKFVEWDTETGRLRLDRMAKLVSNKTKVIACGYASNALGTINDVRRVVELARSAGAYSYIDAVHYAPHGPIDVGALDPDFLVCSAYKFFGPHVGVLYAKQEHLEKLPAYKVRPAPDSIPDRWETGTQNHEGLAGVAAAVDYLAWVGQTQGAAYASQAKGFRGRRKLLKQAMLSTKTYEQTLSRRLLDGLLALDRVSVAGITEPDGLDTRTPTVIFSVQGKTPLQVATALGKAHIYVWDGDYYALEVMRALGREDSGGMVRVGAAHYNTIAEIDRFLEEVGRLAGAKSKLPAKSKTAVRPAKKKAKVQ
jgi:cysteine desulfurase family protein (TIGR01976 family)